MRSIRTSLLSQLGVVALGVTLIASGCQSSDVAADETAQATEAQGEQETSFFQKVREVFVEPTYTVPAGTKLSVRLNQGISTASNESGDRFNATLDHDLQIDGKVLAPAGSEVSGVMTHVDGAGRVKGRAELSLKLTDLTINGQEYSVDSNTLSFRSEGTKKKDAKVIGGSAVAGAVIGALTGGKKGAAVGAGVGGGAGTGYVLATKGKEVEFGPETRLNFTLADSVNLPEAKQ